MITFESEEVSSTTQVIKKPLFMGLDKKQQPFRISAQKATRFTDSENIFNLDKPNGEIETNSEKFYIYGNTKDIVSAINAGLLSFLISNSHLLTTLYPPLLISSQEIIVLFSLTCDPTFTMLINRTLSEP